MKAEIIATGTELLLGEISDANTPFIAGQLAMLGIDLYYVSTVGDNYDRLLQALKQAWQRSDIIIFTGGLGPTQGDITREVVAGMLNEKMEVDARLKQNLVAYFARVGVEMPENNIKQATLIPSATAMPNPLGTAPGWWVEKEGRIIVTLPGPPSEMQPMWQSQVLPRLEKRTGAIILSRTLKTWGLSESKVDQLVSPLLSVTNPTLALYAKPDGIHLRITAKADNMETARKVISERELKIKEILKDYLWGADNDTLEGVVADLLMQKGLTLAIAESFTGGFLSYTLASIPESPNYFKGGVILGGSDSMSVLELKSGSENASSESAATMASAVRSKFGADIGIGVDGRIEAGQSVIAGTAFIAIDAGRSNESITKSYSARPYQLVRRATQQTLFQLRNLLISM